MRNLLCYFLLAATAPAFAEESIPTQPATLLFKAAGNEMNVAYYTSSAAQPCEGLTSAAGVYDAELMREKLLGFIARSIEKNRALVNIRPQVEKQVTPEVPLQVLGAADFSRTNAMGTFAQSCGPFTQQFVPKGGHKYLILFKFVGNRCGQSVQDITDAGAPAEIETQSLQCDKPR